MMMLYAVLKNDSCSCPSRAIWVPEALEISISRKQEGDFLAERISVGAVISKPLENIRELIRMIIYLLARPFEYRWMCPPAPPTPAVLGRSERVVAYSSLA